VKSAKRTFLILTLLFFMHANSTWSAEVFNVTRVLNGHTMELSDGRTIRLIGVHAATEEGTTFVRDLLEGKGITLDFDELLMDENGHTLVYALMVETYINATILLAGYGTPQSMPPNTKYDEFFLKLYKDAVANKRGLWKK